MRTAYSYIRMSTEIQLKGDSLRRQLEASEKYARDNDLILVDSIEGISLKDIGVSGYKGKNSKKGMLAIFLEALELGKIKPNSVLLIESLDRLSRDRLTEALNQFMHILDQGIEIITLIDNQKYTKEIINHNPGALIVSLVIMFRANEESESKSKRGSAAWENKRTKVNKEIFTKTCPAWLKYSESTQKFEIIKGHDITIKTIFDMCINTGGLYSIARYLNENKIPPFGNGKLWYISYVKKIIDNRAVIGEFQLHKAIDGKRKKIGEPVKEYFPKIIDENTFLLAHASIAKRTQTGKGRKGTNFANVFTGLVYCGLCGSKMMLKNRGRQLRSSRTLACNNSKLQGGCQMTEWNLADFEVKLFRHLKDINFSELIETKKDINEISINEQKSAMCEKLKMKEQEIDLAIVLSLKPEFSYEVKKRYESKINAIDLEIKEIKFQIEDLTKKIIENTENQEIFTKTVFKEMLGHLETRKNDYLFRSTVNQFLRKAIFKIELFDITVPFMPREYEEDDRIVKEYRNTFPIRAKRSLREIVEEDDFKYLAKTYERQIAIIYSTGIGRLVFWGENQSYKLKSNIKEEIDKQIDDML